METELQQQRSVLQTPSSTKLLMVQHQPQRFWLRQVYATNHKLFASVVTSFSDLVQIIINKIASYFGGLSHKF